MTDHESIFTILKQQEKILEGQSRKLESIENIISSIAVQEKVLQHQQSQIDALWRKYDTVLGANGVLSSVRSYQAACPGEALKRSIGQLWTAMGFLIALIGAIKIWG